MSDVAASIATTTLAPSPGAVIAPPPAPPAPSAPQKPLGGTILRGIVWLGAVRWVAQLFTWASTLIIARLLAPEDYGLVAMATVLTGFLEVITDLGLGSALVQSRDLTRRQVEEAMGATLLLGLGAALLLGFSAPLWAHVQGDSRIVPIVQALAFGVFLTVIANVPYNMLHKRMAFGVVARAQFVRGLSTGLATLGAALVLQSHWALVVGYLIGKSAFTYMLMAGEPTRARLPTRGSRVGELLRFGGVLTADRILNYARSKIDVALIGALLGTRMVGIYVMSVAVARMPLEKLGSAFEPVAYPAFARLRDDPAELRRFFLGLSLGTMAIALPAAFGMVITADLLVPTVLGQQWVAAVRPLQVLAIVTPLAFHLSLVNALFNAMGRVDINLRLTTIMSGLTIASVLASVRFGVVGIAVASGVAFAVVWCYAEVLVLRVTGIHWRQMGAALVPAISSSLGMTACVYLAASLLPATWPGVVRLLIECGVGMLSFIAWALGVHRRSVVPQLQALRTAWRSR